MLRQPCKQTPLPADVGVLPSLLPLCGPGAGIHAAAEQESECGGAGWVGMARTKFPGRGFV